METKRFFTRGAIYSSAITLLLLSTGCSKYLPGKKVMDHTAGLNGGFEVAQNGLPVNWIFYTPEHVPGSDFEISLDDAKYKDGTQSLRFDVLELPTESDFLPGFTNEFQEAGKFVGAATYNVSFWIKNEGAAYEFSAGPVTAMGGDVQVLTSTPSEQSDWRKMEYQIDIPADEWLRVELLISQAGTLWIDDVQVTAQ